MKTHELASILVQGGKILQKMPNMDLLIGLKYLEQLLHAEQLTIPQHETPAHLPPSNAQATPPPTHRPAAQLAELNAEELENYLRSSTALKTKSQLETLARELELSFKARTTKEQFIQLIVSHFELQRTHSMIRSYQPTHL